MGFLRSSRRIVFALGIAAGFALAPRTQDEPATVHGRAVDRDGKPLAGCAVGLFDLGQKFDTRDLLAAPRTTTDATGRYQLTAKQGHYHVVVVAAKGHQVCVQRLQGERGVVRHLPDALMLPGTSLRGRVRDGNGKPVAGALVRVEDPLTADTFTMAWFESQVRSDDKGIFDVPGVPRTGLRVTVSAPGFPAVSRLAAHDSPLDVTLAATGLVRGTVVDADGKPVPQATVNVITVERQDRGEDVRTDGEGRFVVTVPRAARFRVAAHEGKPPHRSFSSGLLRGPADGVVVTDHVAGAPGKRQVTLRCVDAATKAPIEQFHASWRAIDSKTSVLVLMNHPETRQPYRGEAVLEVAPDPGDKTLGTIVVDAPGHGFAIVAIPDDPREPLVAELPTECFVTGTVTDAETGKPAAGAAVRALPHASVHGGGPDPWKVGAITDADGRYRLGGLAPGDYDVQVYGRGRPASRSARVTVGGAEDGKLDLEVPKTRYLEFELVGDVPAGCLGMITWGGGFSSTLGDGVMLAAQLPGPPTVPLQGPRTHKLGPVGNAQFRAQLRLPTRDRVGSGLTIDLGEIDSRARLQLPDLRQFVHSGRVELPPDVPAERVAVVAHRDTARGARDPFASLLRQPFANCLGSDGSFVLDLPPGRYALQLVDLETGLLFHTEDEDRELGSATAATPLVLRPTIRWLEIAFEPTDAGGEVVCQGIAIDAERPRGGALPALFGSGSGSNTRQQGYWAWRAGTLRSRWLVGSGNLKLKATQTFQVLSPTSTGWRENAVDRADVDPTGPESRVTLRIPPPPDDATILGASGK